VRVNTKVVWDIATGRVLERDSYEYAGPVERCDPASLIGIITAVVGAVGAGKSIAGAVEGGGGGPPKPPTPSPAETAATAEKGKASQIASLQAAFPSIQSLTGGSLSPEAWVRMAELLTGAGGTPGIGAAEGDILKRLSGESNPFPFLVQAGNQQTGTTATTSGLTPPGATP